MAGYEVRPLAELSRQARGFFTQSIPGAVASVWANTFTVVAKVMALLGHEHELRREWLFRQIFASSADDLWLDRHGFELGLTRVPGARATGSVTIAAVQGLVVPSGLTLVRGDGLTYVTLAGAISLGASVELPVEADLAGAAANLPAGATLAVDALSSVAGLGDFAVVDAVGLTAGADPESRETFRARVLARKRRPPQGGSASDYEAWAREALPTVRSVWVDSFVNDARSIWVMFTVTDQPNGIPTPAQVAIVQAYIDDPVRRPVTARAFAVAPVPAPVPVAIRDLAPDTPATRAAIEAELAAVFIDRARPSTPTSAFSLEREWINEGISRAVGEDSHDLLAPAIDLEFPVGTMPVLGAITYSA